LFGSKKHGSEVKTAYYLSIPVVIGAVFSHRMAVRLAGPDPVHWATWPVLALVVWAIYTADRLLDIRKPNGADTPRHRFHRQHAKRLWQVVVGALVVAGGLALFLPGGVIRFGVVLALICAGYVLVVFQLPARHWALLLKEPLVAVLFSAGVWGSVWAQRPTVSGIEIATAALFTAIACQNLLLFSVFELRETPQRTAFSLATAWGVERCETTLRWLTIVLIISSLSVCFLTEDRFTQRTALILGLMSIALFGIGQYPVWFLKNERYRWLGDLVFWMPALVL
jgi:hypothetical protein